MDNEKVQTEEKEYFEIVMDEIKNLIEYNDDEFKKWQNTIIGFKEGMRGTQFTRQSMMSMTATAAQKLRDVYDNPYFGRIDFWKDGESSESKIYVGRSDVVSNDNILVYDWRNPVCSLYYDDVLGRNSYDAPKGKVFGNVLSKRSIIIKDGKFVSALEGNIMSDDDLLLPYLTGNADNRLKTIIASVQKDQNDIIRRPLSDNIIVQGVAGSGKTTVALHRIAYLVYNLMKKNSSNQFMIIGPNNYFLNYISGVLPDLDINSISQYTFNDLAFDELKKRYKLVSDNEDLERVISDNKYGDYLNFKSSLNYKDCIEKYLNNYIDSCFDHDLMIDKTVLLSIEKIRRFSEVDVREYARFSKIDSYMKYAKKYVKENAADIKCSVFAKYREEFKSLPKDSERKKEILNIVENCEKEIDKNCEKIIKDYFSFSKVSAFDLYKNFIIDCFPQCEQKNELLKRLNSKKVDTADLTAILYIQLKLYGDENFKDIRNVVIDEAQDYSDFQFFVLNALFNNANKSIFGDIGQSIYSYKSINNWDNLNKNVFDNKMQIVPLVKSYRSTSEIMDDANLILNDLNVDEAVSVLRHGSDVDYVGNCNKYEFIKDCINNSILSGLNSIAVICKDELETNNLYKKLIKDFPSIHKINYDDKEFNSGICIMPCYLSKGLEFDSVILSDASEDIYKSSSDLDKKLLYVSMTRALHKLSVYYDGELNNILNKRNQKVKVRK